MLVPSALFLAQIGAPQKPSLLEVFLQVGPMGWTVATILIVMSFASWTIAGGKWIQMRRAERASGTFLETFRSSQRFSEVGAAAQRLGASPLVGLFQAGYAEIDSQIKTQRLKGDADEYRIRSLESLQRTLRRAVGSELRLLSKGTTFLATVAAAGPFIGLFGTVWGIMVAFQDIGVTGSTSLVAVAPGIAEALINTALGLVAAIPALLAYNYFASRLRQFRAELDDFTLEFMNLAERNFT
jgi:biopolymer transport protein TolQ